MLYSREIRKGVLAALFLAEGIIMLCVAVSFWSEFLIEQVDQCTSHFDCFALLSGRPVQRAPLDMENCSLYEMSPNHTILCFRYAFNYIDAIGNSGSVLVIGTLVMNIHSAISAGAYTLKGRKAMAVKIVLLLYFILGGLVMLLISPLVAGTTNVVRRALWNTNNGIIQFVAYYFTFNFAFFVSGPGFIYPSVLYPPVDGEVNCTVPEDSTEALHNIVLGESKQPSPTSLQSE